MFVRAVLCLAITACGSTTPPPKQSPTVVTRPVDAGIEPAPADAMPAAETAPPFMFRYATAERSETWTLRYAEGNAVLVVMNHQGPRRYTGSAIESDGALEIEVTSSNAKMALKCKRDKLAVSAKCNDRKAKPVEVLSCYHADFTTPMPFAPPPGIEYLVDSKCNGYRMATP